MAFRPKNETAEDLANENEAAEIIARVWEVEVIKLSDYLYRADWALVENGGVKAFAEFKRRSKKHDKLMISVAKYMYLLELSRCTGLPSLLIIRWPDGLWYHKITYPVLLPLDIRVGGNSRGQNGDIEPIIYIPIEQFKQIKTDG